MIIKCLVNFKAVNSLVSNSEEYDWRTAETEEADDENANQKYIFGKDESPGLYGEVADYWKSYEDSDITDRNQTSSNTYNNSTVISNTQCALVSQIYKFWSAISNNCHSSKLFY